LENQPMSAQLLGKLRQHIVDTHHCRLQYPSGETYGKWLREAGFRTVSGYASGASAAIELFKATPVENRPTTMERVDQLLRPMIETAVNREVVLSACPMITAQK
jgi:hypothetical protein